ncbi:MULTISPECIES: bifunctional precorrin-2 dehydrogenase/sirohydrochlorin ferrochelatase [Pseudobutyrivibrio]|jgi:uroporphyrin-III C-methyltransferase/precorrin-2 dehydrogenase/sirohydrochlorin ferrochelatase/precorrin-2 dehydrogenase/sirohydrochlorin ferrochelatase|uniref:precorrin-2 dehydrogenase n=1 Tax=Pseudobutyrivibrio xylanivorans TaxID=185007 RepID=A0A6M0LHU5_PSEXY|nr:MULTISPECIES: bifunctional precorrin-2 dehydrogenase/sirohydrochlorin ferrochelatase [Pseudobutyrivibrio]NEX01513.1 bifunctional precorrin-2 dehydrogenase/sirohydrochlorin ferrochelatase [Pseudobutyrivibrio xylanivorans]SFR68049.1 precorrin-2 dehydrogenase / sirohydrochlorin ferrochelatase [Pseudobutyrivibrio sp. NOR37]
MAYFPMFVDLTDANCLVVGGGSVALRKVNVLLDFGAKVHVIAKEISMDLAALSEETDHLLLEQREFTPFDLQDRKLVIVATSDNELNGQIYMMCSEGGIPVNVVDDQEKCSFIFPSYIKEQNLVGAFSSGGNSPALTQYLKNKEKEILTPRLGELNEVLGRWRQPIKELFPLESSRKSAFEQLIDYALCYDGIPTDEEIEELLGAISMTL